MRHLISFFSSLFVAADFLALNLFQILALPIGLFSKKALKKVHHLLVDICVDVFVFAMTKILRIKINVSGDEPIPNEDVILIANHQAFADVPIVAYFASLTRRAKHLRYFTKDSFKWIPGPGWGLHFTGSIFLKRNWNRDIENINKTFSKLKNYNDRFWLIVYPEGTRVNPKKIEASKKYMIQNGLEPLNSRVMPRAKGFHAALLGLGERVDAIYDLSIEYPNETKAPSLWKFMSGVDFNLKMKRYSRSEIPESLEGTKSWLLERIREKDT